MKTATAVSAGGVILDNQGRVVLTARRSFKGKLQWGLPKGIVEAGEDRAETAAREAHEETGLEVEVLQPLTTIDYWFVQPGREGSPPTRIHKFVHFYLMKPVGGDPAKHNRETEEVAFLDPEEAISRASFATEKEVIRAAVELLRKRE
jgi:8-oxo-dGTP pyrophosphatase MutT (NUDIX family)